MRCPIVIQTCDRYEFAWKPLFHFIDRYWEKNIAEIFFCTEEKKPNLPKGFNLIRTGKGSFVSNLKNILSEIESEDIFYLLEDYWPIAPFKKRLFDACFSFFKEKQADAFQISSYTPHYNLIKTEYKIDNLNVYKFSNDNKWMINFNARFWKKECLLNCLFEPKISESRVNSAITVEVECNQKLNNLMNVYFIHYFWYPISGVLYRRKFTDIGLNLLNIYNIDTNLEELIKN